MENAAMQQSYDPRAANGGYSRPSATVAGAIAPLDDLAKQFEVARDRVSQSIQRAKGIAESLLGPEPEGKPTGPDHPPRIGRMGSLGDQVEYLHAGLGELERQISRIGQIG